MPRLQKKIKSDFSGAKNHWKDELKVWVFVWSHHEALPPQALSALQKLQEENYEQIKIDQWGRERLWEFVSEISHEKRIELLGNVPAIRNISDSNAAEVQALLNYLARNEGMEMDESDIGFTNLSDKIQRNRLGPAVTKLISGTLPVARVVEDYVSKHPDMEYSAIVASSLSKAYEEAVSSGITHPDEIFAQLVRFVSRGFMEPKIYWSAVGIIVHYFQLCEIFDR